MLTQLRSSKVYERITRREIVKQFIKYGVVGVVNVSIHVLIFNLLVLAGLPALGANAIAFFLASINSFILNKKWAFRDQRRQAVVRQYLVFLSFTLIGLGLHTGAFSLLLIPLHPHGTLGKNLALLAALPVSVVWNFTCYRLWTFSPTSTGELPTPDPRSAAV